MPRPKTLDEKIVYYQHLASILEPSVQAREDYRQAIIEYTEQFLINLANDKAFRAGESRAIYNHFFSEKAISIEKALNIFKKDVEYYGLNAASGRYLGYIPGSGLYTSALGDFLSDVINRVTCFYALAPGAVCLENMIIRWLADLLRFPKSAAGNLTSDGSMANLIALTVARDAHNILQYSPQKIVIYLSEQAHHCIDKALHIVGLGQIVKHYLPLDADFRIQADTLASLIQQDKKAGLMPWLVMATAGTTNTGAVDPLSELGDIAKANHLWFHIDAAYGGFFLLTDTGKKLLQGIQKADSVVLDPHKGLFLPYGLGVVVVRKYQHLRRSFAYEANYIKDSQTVTDELSPADLSPELSRPFRGLRLWLPLQLHGIAPFRAALEEKLLLTQYFAQEIKKIKNIELVCEPQLSIVAFRYLPEKEDVDQFNLRLQEKIRQDGRVFLSSTQLRGHVYLRFACLSFRTHKDVVDETVEIVREMIDFL